MASSNVSVRRLLAAGAALAIAALALAPVVDRETAACAVGERLDQIDLARFTDSGVACTPGTLRTDQRGSLLSSWQTIGGCGASSATGSGVGVKWIGRGVSGGLFNVQTQVNYSPLAASGTVPGEKNWALNNLLTKDLGDWVVGFNVPYVYKYLDDPFGTDVDLSNGGWGDVSLQVTRKLGPINATQLTAVVGLPTAKYDERYKMKLLRQHQQLGFGKTTASLALDHTMDELWGQTLVGAVAAWRGGENPISNYRAPSATGYGYVGAYLGPFYPALGLALTGFSGHDRDQTEDENTGLASAAANLTIEWSSSWLALQLGASFPYQYDGISEDANGKPKSPWGWGSWIVAFGVQVSP